MVPLALHAPTQAANLTAFFSDELLQATVFLPTDAAFEGPCVRAGQPACLLASHHSSRVCASGTGETYSGARRAIPLSPPMLHPTTTAPSICC